MPEAPQVGMIHYIPCVKINTEASLTVTNPCIISTFATIDFARSSWTHLQEMRKKHLITVRYEKGIVS
jgi:hypothetical protein